ncbi:MAG: glutathione S-transferase family protein [Myxococcota bacterium]
MTVRLLTIPMSHYCDKARWALEHAGIPYAEEPHLQLLHRLATRREGGGSVPLLVTPDGPVTDSADIVAWTDSQRAPEHRLATPEAEAWAARFDRDLGPPARLWAYDRAATQAHLAWRFGIAGVPWWQRAAFPFLYWPMLAAIRQVLGWTDATVAEAQASVDRQFDEVADVLSDGRPFLCGDRFTAADLTFASMTAAVLLPPEYGIALPQPADLPARAADEVTRRRAHPAGAFALRMYREHRPARRVG